MDTVTAYQFLEADQWLQTVIDKGNIFHYGEEPEIEHWLDLSYLIINASQLFKLYLWNYEQLTKGLNLMISGEVKDVFDNGSNQSDFIRINGYTSNMISNGINLINYLDSLCTNEQQKGYESLALFEKLRNEMFDNNFNYALANLLRNYAQHGQLLVSMHSDNGINQRVCFDLYQLMHPALYSLNTKNHKRLMKEYELIREHESDVIRLSFAQFIDSFHLHICQLSYECFKLLDSHVNTAIETVKGRLALFPEKEFLSDSGESFWILIESSEKIEEGDTIHIVQGKPDLLYSEIKCLVHEAFEEKDSARRKLEKTSRCFKPLQNKDAS